ncbi:MAG: efflux RND transporter periplasmic adaptor subunit [Candidatus Thiodiazotropha sp.]
MNIRNWSLCLLALIFFYTHPLTAAEEHDHAEEVTEEHRGEHKDEHGHEDENRVHLNDEQRRSAGIVVHTLTARPVPTEIDAPGEIRLNAYASSQVTPRIEAQVVTRHARLGDPVAVGQPLVTLSSVSMAEAQGELLVAAKEWQRVKNLGKKVVSERRYLEARVAFQQAQAKLLAYGLTSKQTDQLIHTGNITQADGRFTLLSPQDGTVIRDDFITGQMVDPGNLLFELTDESSLWVEARINPRFVSQLNIDASARVLVGDAWIDGKVIQIHHALDETTRTLAVRLEIPNPEDKMHPGQFVTVRIQTGTSGQTALTLPLEAVLRSPDGDWQVFVEEEPGEFEPKEVEVVRQLPGLAVIVGLSPGTRVVTQGAFFVQSELAKSGFDVHNH